MRWSRPYTARCAAALLTVSMRSWGFPMRCPRPARTGSARHRQPGRGKACGRPPRFGAAPPHLAPPAWIADSDWDTTAGGADCLNLNIWTPGPGGGRAAGHGVDSEGHVRVRGRRRTTAVAGCDCSPSMANWPGPDPRRCAAASYAPPAAWCAATAHAVPRSPPPGPGRLRLWPPGAHISALTQAP